MHNPCIILRISFAPEGLAKALRSSRSKQESANGHLQRHAEREHHNAKRQRPCDQGAKTATDCGKAKPKSRHRPRKQTNAKGQIKTGWSLLSAAQEPQMRCTVFATHNPCLILHFLLFLQGWTTQAGSPPLRHLLQRRSPSNCGAAMGQTNIMHGTGLNLQPI